MVLPYHGQTVGVSLIGLHPTHLGLRHQMGRNHHAVYAFFRESIEKVEASEPCFIDQMDRAFGELVPKVLDHYLMLCRHRDPMDEHLVASDRNLPGLLRIFESHKNLFTFDHEILYLTSIHLATSLSLIFCGASTPLHEKEGSLFTACRSSPLL